MALVFCDGCDSYSADIDITRKWGLNTSNAWNYNASGGRTGGGCIEGVATNTNQVPLFTQAGIISSTILGVGFWFKASTHINSSTCKLIDLRDRSNISLGGIGCQVNGLLRYCVAGNSVIGVAGTHDVCDNNWHWIEAYHETGSNKPLRTWVDGVVDINTTGTLNAVATIDRFGLGNNNLNGGVVTTFDDIVVFDNSGSDPLASAMPIGSKLIKTTRPSADTATVQFTTSSGSSHFSLVNGQAPNVDVTYVEDNVSGHQDLYNFGLLGIGNADILAAVVNTYAKNPNAGDQLFQHVVKSGSSGSLDVPYIYVTQQSFFSTDPATASKWGVTSLQAAAIGVKIP